MPTLTFQVDPSKLGELEAARRVIDLLIEGFEGDQQGDDFTRELHIPRPSLTDQVMEQLWPRLNGNVRRLVRHAALLGAQQEDYSVDELAASMGTDAATVRALRSELGTSLRAVERAVPGSSPIFGERFDAHSGGWRHWIAPVYRDAILERDIDETYS